MQVGDLVRNKNAHRLMNSSVGVFLGWRTYEGNRWTQPYTCALVAWFGGRVGSIQESLLQNYEVISNVE